MAVNGLGIVYSPVCWAPGASSRAAHPPCYLVKQSGEALPLLRSREHNQARLVLPSCS